MQTNEPKRLTLAFINPNKRWVVKELDALIEEWHAWQAEVLEIPVPARDRYNPRPEDIFADGEENMHKHDILQEKTLVFLDDNIDGHGFIYGRDGTRIDRNDLRLDIRVKHRIHDLDILRACLVYAKVPDSYWKATAKEMLEKIAGKGPEIAIDIAAKYLQGLA
jgi:hypothetical protein